MDTHIPHLPLPLPQDPMTTPRVNVRARAAAPSSTMFLRFDANRIAWLAAELEAADRPEHARLAHQWAEELRAAADKIDALEGAP